MKCPADVTITSVSPGVPDLFPGVPTSVGTSMLVSSQSLPVVVSVQIGLFSEVNGQIGAMRLSRVISSSLTGTKKEVKR